MKVVDGDVFRYRFGLKNGGNNGGELWTVMMIVVGLVFGVQKS